MWNKLRAAALLAFAGFAMASDGVSISHAWIRLLPGDLPAGGYFVLDNRTDHTVTLTGISAKGFNRAMMHRSMESGGQESMVHVGSLDVPPGGQLRFAPGGYHIMLMPPHEALKVGDRVPVTFEFADGSKLSAEFVVKGAAAIGWTDPE